MDLSAPNGASVNDGIGADVCSLTYASVDNAVSIIQHLGQGTQLVIMDLKDAYHIIPAHPQDHHLLGIQPSIWVAVSTKGVTAFADLVAWAIHLNDFLLFGAPGTLEVASTAAVAMEVLANAGIPVAANKTEGPSTAVTSWVSWWTLSSFN